MKTRRAAGGVVWREDDTRRVAVIHRPRQDDWTLPKGRLEDDEPWDAAALREVREETGCEVGLGDFAGVVSYIARGTPRVVLYWNMFLLKERPREPDREVDQVVWLTPSEALRRLTRRSDRRLLEKAMRRRSNERAASTRHGPVAGRVAGALAGGLLAVAAALAMEADGLRMAPAVHALLGALLGAAGGAVGGALGTGGGAR